ncbi:MAG: glycine zipper 2TM domain-containing protein [Gammaproteobacteria bacterium]|nr:glycine zipper 2TM domain-containing protein [Gammaproteobacteria bacterium]
MISRSITGLIAVGFIASLPAVAQGVRDWDDGAAYDWAEVVDVDPIYRDITVSVPRRECYVETYELPPRADYGTQRAAAGPVILGGLIGAVIGHQFGRGSGRNVGSAAGAVVGAAIGHDAARRRAAQDERYGYDERRTAEREVCRTRREERLERQIDGYRVTYRYNGRDYRTQLPYEPGERIRVRIAVDPVGG